MLGCVELLQTLISQSTVGDHEDGKRSSVYSDASDILTTICCLAIVHVCVIIILSIVNTQISILLLCFLYLFVELMITMNE